MKILLIRIQRRWSTRNSHTKRATLTTAIYMAQVKFSGNLHYIFHAAVIIFKIAHVESLFTCSLFPYTDVMTYDLLIYF